MHAIATEEHAVSHCTVSDKKDDKDGSFFSSNLGSALRQETCRNMPKYVQRHVSSICLLSTAAAARSELLWLPRADCLAGGSGRAGAVP